MKTRQLNIAPILLLGLVVLLYYMASVTRADTVANPNKITSVPVLDKMPDSTANGLHLVASLQDTDVVVGNMVLLKVSLVNTSNNEVSLINQGNPNNEFTFVVKDNNGKDVSLSLWGKSLFKYKPGYMPTANPYESVSGNGKKTYQFSLNRMFDLSIPGSYTVTASRGINPGPGKQIEMLHSSPVVFRLHDPSVNFSDPDSFPLKP